MPERTEMLATYSFAKVLKVKVDSTGDAKHAAKNNVTRNVIFQKDHMGSFEEPISPCDTGTKNVAGIVIVNELQFLIKLEF
jgi:hypothetical protein